MKTTEIAVLMTMILSVLGTSASNAATVTDGFYQMNKNASFSWDGTAADRLVAPTADYAYTYGDESRITYTLPWAFTFYGHPYSTITADSNGNIWLGSSGGGNSFALGSNGVGPVISVWNNDLSSYYYGGVFIQRKSDPEDRVVVEWQTETYANEGFGALNDFEAVIYRDGRIRLDYKGFTPSAFNEDFGSGISSNEGNMNVSITASQGNVFSLSSSSFLFTPPVSLSALDVQFASGTGQVSSNLGLLWTASRPKDLPTGIGLTLQATPAPGYYFNGWSGPCTGTGNCTFNLNQNTVVNASFVQHLEARIGTTDYPTLQAAYTAASASSTDTIQVQALSLTENIATTPSKTVIIQGGCSNDFSSCTGVTNLQTSLHITSGSVTLMFPRFCGQSVKRQVFLDLPRLGSDTPAWNEFSYGYRTAQCN